MRGAAELVLVILLVTLRAMVAAGVVKTNLTAMMVVKAARLGWHLARKSISEAQRVAVLRAGGGHGGREGLSHLNARRLLVRVLVYASSAMAMLRVNGARERDHRDEVVGPGGGEGGGSGFSCRGTMFESLLETLLLDRLRLGDWMSVFLFATSASTDLVAFGRGWATVFGILCCFWL